MPLCLIRAIFLEEREGDREREREREKRYSYLRSLG